MSTRVREVSKTGQIAKLSRPMWKWEALATVMDGLKNPAGTVTVVTIQDGVKNRLLFYFLGSKATLYIVLIKFIISHHKNTLSRS